MLRTTGVLLIISLLILTFSPLNVSAEQETVAEPSAVTESTAFEKVFQTASVVIMTIGVVGLPVYFWLNWRKRRVASETDDSSESDVDNESKEELQEGSDE